MHFEAREAMLYIFSSSIEAGTNMKIQYVPTKELLIIGNFSLIPI